MIFLSTYHIEQHYLAGTDSRRPVYVLQLYLACLAIGVETGVFSSYGGNVLNRLKAAFDKGDLETARLEQVSTQHTFTGRE